MPTGCAVAGLVVGVAGVVRRHIVGARVDLVARVGHGRAAGDGARSGHRARAARVGRAVVDERPGAHRRRRGRRLGRSRCRPAAPSLGLVVGVAGVVRRHVVGARVDLVAGVGQRRGAGAEAPGSGHRARAARVRRAVVHERPGAHRRRRGRRLGRSRCRRLAVAGRRGWRRRRSAPSRSRCPR